MVQVNLSCDAAVVSYRAVCLFPPPVCLSVSLCVSSEAVLPSQ